MRAHHALPTTRSRPGPLPWLLAAVLLLPVGLVLLPAGLRAQVAAVDLVDRGRPVPLSMTAEERAMGRAVAHGLLAGASRDVTRPVSDADLRALGSRGTLLRIRLRQPESIFLVRLGVRMRPSRLAAYVPPGRDDHAYVFLGGSSWQRIVMVDLPAAVRQELRALRARGD